MSTTVWFMTAGKAEWTSHFVAAFKRGAARQSLMTLCLPSQLFSRVAAIVSTAVRDSEEAEYISTMVHQTMVTISAASNNGCRSGSAPARMTW